MPKLVKKPILLAYFSGKFSVIILAKIKFIHPPATPKKNLPMLKYITFSTIVIIQLMTVMIYIMIAARLLPLLISIPPYKLPIISPTTPDESIIIL